MQKTDQHRMIHGKGRFGRSRKKCTTQTHRGLNYGQTKRCQPVGPAAHLLRARDTPTSPRRVGTRNSTERVLCSRFLDKNSSFTLSSPVSRI